MTEKRSITELLNQVQLLETKRLQKVEEERRRGEWFNVFNVLGMSTDEVHTHSAFIAELLNPQGSHGCGDEFLKAFIEIIPGLEGFEIETVRAKTQVELSIGRINEDYTEGGRLDIIAYTDTHAIIIENKIYAGDGWKQLMRYHEFAEREYKNNYRILYLTLDGGSPSEGSTGKHMEEGKDYYSISYASDIINWLQRCIAIAVSKPLVRETLVQYLNLIKQLTNQTMEQNDKKELFELLTKYPEATASILNAKDEYIHFLYDKYVLPKIKTFVENNNLLYHETENLWTGKPYNGLYFRREDWKHYAIWIYSRSSGLVNFYDCISTYNGDPYITKQSQLGCMGYASDDKWWPYGWSWFDYDKWDASVIPDMIDKDGHNPFAETIIDRIKTILEEVERKQLPEKDNW